MDRPCSIFRRSVHNFLKNYNFFASTAALLALPFSVSVFLSQSLASPSIPTIHTRIRAIFDAAGFPSSSQFFSVICLKLSQTVSSFSFTLPCSITFLLISKASIILSLSRHSKLALSFSSFIHTYKPLLLTCICNSVVIVSANATAFSVLFFAYNCLGVTQIQSFTSPGVALFLSASGAILYSIILAHAVIISSFALILSGTEKLGGFEAILKACVLIRNSIPLALSLAIPMNLAWAAVEALFQYRVVRAYRIAKGPSLAMALEGLLIAYLYSIIVVLDTIVGCFFYKSCKRSRDVLCIEDEYHCRLEIAEDAEHTEQAVKS